MEGSEWKISGDCWAPRDRGSQSACGSERNLVDARSRLSRRNSTSQLSCLGLYEALAAPARKVVISSEYFGALSAAANVQESAVSGGLCGLQTKKAEESQVRVSCLNSMSPVQHVLNASRRSHARIHILSVTHTRLRFARCVLGIGYSDGGCSTYVFVVSLVCRPFSTPNRSQSPRLL